jgi:hypothetical protein
MLAMACRLANTNSIVTIEQNSSQGHELGAKIGS